MMDRKYLLKNFLEWIICIIIEILLSDLFRYFIGTPTVVKMNSMYPTLEPNQRLWLNRLERTTKTLPERGEIITFEKPSITKYTYQEIDKDNPKAKYNEKHGIEWFIYNFLEIGKESYIKRVIALPGEHVEIKNGNIFINGEKLDEPYLQDGILTDVVGAGFDDFIVPESCVFAIGDNRNYSIDCRAFGCIPLEKIESSVAIRIWPLNKLGKVR